MLKETIWGLLLAVMLALPLLATSGAVPGTAAQAATTSCLPSSLKNRLSQIRSRFGSIKVISTYRKGARIRGSGKRSYHASCRAVDFIPPPGKYRAVTNWLYANHDGGVGTYSCMNHIHIDNGRNYRWSKCR
jgi:uncharacterized protein YcbK (DUF882 family)